MLWGMDPVKLFALSSLHPNIQTQIGCGAKFNAHRIKYALHSAIYFQVISPSSIIAAQNNPYKAHNGSIETRIPTWKWGMSNSRWFRKRSLRISSHADLCPLDICSICCVYTFSRCESFSTYVVVGRESHASYKHNVFCMQFHTHAKLTITNPQRYWHEKITHGQARDVKFPMLLGMEYMSC